MPFRRSMTSKSFTKALDDRVMAGFGGVAEYGITVRWDKNFLKIIRLLIERRAQFAMFGGVRFGGTITIDNAFAMGFDHIALCAGRGPADHHPNEERARARRAPGVGFPDGAAIDRRGQDRCLANLQVRLPVVVIGGGLTAIDTATESLAYYPVQVEKFLARYETLVAERGEAAVRAAWREEDRESPTNSSPMPRRSATNAKPRNARTAAAISSHLLDQWGGVTIAYRRRLIDAPSYTLNHEEVAKAMEEGIRFAECLAPEEVEGRPVRPCRGADLARQKSTPRPAS